MSKTLLARSGVHGSLSLKSQLEHLERWLLGETGDPLAIPFALFLERHSGSGDDPEFFLPEEKKFRLSHRSLVDPPMELALALDASFLQRSEMQVIREIFRHCESRHSRAGHQTGDQPQSLVQQACSSIGTGRNPSSKRPKNLDGDVSQATLP